ncbi:hypothetical protein Tsubulata_013625 [Turnera subulata]|uniref:CRM domain-containing protein n=1 Tax=Turnera subulata TaxID=218843 RepID=A0A9Q0F990_9ROSI|nr:hypothetical protein Tsubulata_013625 [Turnera subulata]
MWLSVNPSSPSPPPKFLTHHQSPPLFPIPKTLILSSLSHNKTRIRSSPTPDSSSASDTQTLPHSAIQRIADKLRSLGFTSSDDHQPPPPPPNPAPETKSAGEIFIPLPGQLSKYRVGHTLDPSWSTPEKPTGRDGGAGREEWKDNAEARRKEREKRKVPTAAELNLGRPELRRLRTVGIAEKRMVKVGKAGITEGILNSIHERWRRSEVVKIVCEDLCKQNMKRTHDLLERKTGGMVVWRSGSKIVLYRGVKYKYPYFLSDGSNENVIMETGDGGEKSEAGVDVVVESSRPSSGNGVARPVLIRGVGAPNKVRFQLPGEAQFAEEADQLLEGLGPRFTDWWGYDPLPVDADLLPAVVPGFRPPFRLLPYGVKPILTNDEVNTLKRLGRPLPCHFALSRNSRLQGLAVAIFKLWEKCEIAKIAIKRGVDKTSSELMAEELKRLTGGNLLSRDEEFIVFYRGKDFLPSAVSLAMEQRKRHVIHADKQRTGNATSESTMELQYETKNVVPRAEIPSDQSCALPEHRELQSTEAAIESTRIKLSTALEKKAEAEKLLAESEKAEVTQQPETDKEGITEEERYMLRKVGLKMGPFLLIGRRGVFAGTVENMHLHWKYRELVKIICKERNIEAANQAAQILEAESGGILVAVEKVSKGYAIIVYRGRNYKRPASLRPSTLLSKREAMKLFLEAQRRESLKLHVLELGKKIDDLKHQLTGGKHGVDSNFCYVNIDHDASVERVRPAQLADQSDQTLTFSGNDTGRSESDFQSVDCGTNEGLLTSAIVSSTSVSAEHRVAGQVEIGGSVQSAKDDLEESVSSAEAENKMPPRVTHLSNRDRLLLRKQALRMKKRPVLAVARSNIVTGVAKTIATHFKKHPLAIVNVKGRAKGTSVRELASRLEQETGALLVSLEVNKIILYRGWGAEIEPGLYGPNLRHAARASLNVGKVVVSPELMEAIKLECGLQHNQEES